MRNLLLAGFLTFTISACSHKEKAPEAAAAATGTTATPAPTPATVTTNNKKAPAKPLSAQANLKSVQGQLKGVVHFTQAGDKIKVTAMVEGLKSGPHGFFLAEKNLGNIIADSKGKGKHTAEITDMNMNRDPEDKKSIIGKTVWIYAGPSFKGAKIASGVVQ